VFKNEQELLNKLFMLYVLQVGLLNELLLLWHCVTCTYTKLPQGPVHHTVLILCSCGLPPPWVVLQSWLSLNWKSRSVTLELDDVCSPNTTRCMSSIFEKALKSVYGSSAASW